MQCAGFRWAGAVARDCMKYALCPDSGVRLKGPVTAATAHLKYQFLALDRISACHFVERPVPGERADRKALRSLHLHRRGKATYHHSYHRLPCCASQDPPY